MNLNKLEIDKKILEAHSNGLVNYDNWYLIKKGEQCSFHALLNENEIVYILENNGEVSDSSDFDYMLNEFNKANTKNMEVNGS